MKAVALVVLLGAGLAVVAAMAAPPAARPDASRPPPGGDGSGLPDSAAPRDASLPDAVPPDGSEPAPGLGITSFAPTRAEIGELVTIMGQGFGPAVGVTHGGVVFPVKQVAPSQVVVVVPVGARGTHPFVVQDEQDTAESSDAFTVLPRTGPRRPPGIPEEPLR